MKFVPTPHSGTAARGWLFVLAVAVVSALAITSRSFWIDECYSARFAQQPSLAACWHLLMQIRGSDPQMPLYIFWIWCCEKFTGASELALRAVNLFWFIPALIVLARAFTGNRGLQTAVFLAAVLNPFAWYYLNEARAYTMQFSTSLILFAAICHWTRNQKSSVAAESGWMIVFCVALFWMCGSSILSMILAVAPLLLALVVLPGKRQLEFAKKFWLLWIITLIALFGLGLYYLWTLYSGDRGTPIATTGWKNVVFVAYELFGFAGLGPGRLDIRDNGLVVFKPYAAVLILYAAVVAVLVALAALDLWRRFGGKKVFFAFLTVTIPPAFILATGAFLHFRVLGRHLAAMLPVVVLLLGLGLHSAWRRGMAGKILTAGFLALYLASSLSLRFAARHEKDDYRDAAAFARKALAAGKSVWWNADENAAIYYHVPLAKHGVTGRGQALWLVHPTRKTLAAAQAPDVIIASRPDVYDEHGALAGLIARRHYQLATNLMAFTIWTRPDTGG